MLSSVLFAVFAVSFHSITPNAFLTQTPVSSRQPPFTPTSSFGLLRMSDNEQDNLSQLTKLGYSETEVRQSARKAAPEEIKVRVDLVNDVDPVTLTAIGFALIALNFLVFANMGDGGIAGIVATIINSS
jgi:hypothetical protein